MLLMFANVRVTSTSCFVDVYVIPTLCVKINIINLRGFSFDSPPFLPIRFSQSQNNPVKQAISEIVPVQFIAKLI
jgi:hypothetical protein